MSDQNEQKLPVFSTTDKIISFGLFFVVQMIIAFLINILANRVLTSFHVQAISYWTTLSAWLLWIMVFILPLLTVGFLVVQELMFHVTKLLAVLSGASLPPTTKK
jgi:hypothetical protein